MAVVVYTNNSDRIACAALAGNLVRLDLGEGGGTLLLRPIAGAAKISHEGTDGAAVGTNYCVLDADAWTPWPVRGLATLYLAHTANNGVVEVWMTPESTR